jgi:WD40 repeat protein
VRAPETIGVGQATVRLAFAAWPEGKVAPTTTTVTILAAKPGAKLEAASPRFQRELIHPNRQYYIMQMQFSPDGQRLLAGDYPGGVLQLWEVRTGKQLTKIETGYGYRGSAQYFAVSPDWKRVYVDREKQHLEQIEKEGKRLIRWSFTGDIRAWDLETGRLITTYRHEPQRAIMHTTFAPDGKTFLTSEEPPGEFVSRPERTASLWDVQTKEPRPVPRGAGHGAFSPDSRTILYADNDQQGYAQAIRLWDTGSGQEKLAIPIATPNTWVDSLMFLPDGKAFVGTVRVFPTARQWSSWETTLKIWDVSTGKELASIPEMPNTSFHPTFSPDGKLFAADAWRDPRGRLLLFDVERKRPRKNIVLGGPVAPDLQTMLGFPVFSPDGKWLAVGAQVTPKEPRRGGDALALPQRRIHLIEVATGEVRETLVAPPETHSQLCFSPDGKTLAVGAKGKVLLVDLTQPPGTIVAAERK